MNYNIGFISAVQQSDAVICRNCMCASHTHTSFFIFSIMVYHRILNTLPVLYGRALLLIHSVCNSLHPLTLNSRSIPSPPCSLLAVISQLSVFLNFAFTLSSSSPPVLTWTCPKWDFTPHQSTKIVHVQVIRAWFSVLRWRGLLVALSEFVTSSSSLESSPGLQSPCPWFSSCLPSLCFSPLCQFLPSPRLLDFGVLWDSDFCFVFHLFSSYSHSLSDLR